MKSRNRFLISLVTTILVVVIFTFGCKKANDSPEIAFGSITDQESNTYKTIEIGTQTWMAENLKTTKYNDNTSIPNVSGNAAWANLKTPGYCWYDNDETTNKTEYGALYNWYAVNTGKLCPTGWHVPSDAEYKTLEMSLELTQVQANDTLWRGTNPGAEMKDIAGWKTGENGTNTSGFSALPGGYRYHRDGTFYNITDLSYWWCSDDVTSATGYYRRLDGGSSGIYRAGTLKAAGKYVRCLKD